MLVNAYCTHRSPPPLSFKHQLNARRDRSDPDLDEHLRGFMGFVMGGGSREMTQTRYAVLRHLQRVQHHLSFDLDEADMDACARWATQANAIVFLADGTVRAADGHVLVDPENGDAEPGARVPYPEDALARKAKTEDQLVAMGIKTPASLPPVVSEIEVEFRAARDVVLRSVALIACAVRAESLNGSDPVSTADLKRNLPRAYDAMSPRERAFFDAPAPPRQEVVNHTWRHEALLVLEWALGLVPELPPPTSICDVPRVAKVMFKANAEALIREAKLRPVPEILDALDLTFRLHWTTYPRVNGRPPPSGIEPGVVSERHHALNWLTRFEDADWDDVETPT